MPGVVASTLKLDETSFTFELPDLDDIPEDRREELIEEVGQYLVESILDYVGDSKSPVAGGEFKKKLSEAYARFSGKEDANLDLNGSMLDSLEYVPDYEAGTVTIGIFNPSETPKSFNHNTGDTLPKRQFIPGKGEELQAEIVRGIGRIIEDYIDGEE
jgi:hypothetical protein